MQGMALRGEPMQPSRSAGSASGQQQQPMAAPDAAAAWSPNDYHFDPYRLLVVRADDGAAAAAAGSAELVPPVLPSPDAVEGNGGERLSAGGTCKVRGCSRLLSQEKRYYQRFLVCEEHMRSQSIEVGGRLCRFCQQCGKFEPVEAFDGIKRSCRARLLEHNKRRRKAGGSSRKTRRPAAANKASGGAAAAAEGDEPAAQLAAMELGDAGGAGTSWFPLPPLRVGCEPSTAGMAASAASPGVANQQQQQLLVQAGSQPPGSNGSQRRLPRKQNSTTSSSAANNASRRSSPLAQAPAAAAAVAASVAAPPASHNHQQLLDELLAGLPTLDAWGPAGAAAAAAAGSSRGGPLGLNVDQQLQQQLQTGPYSPLLGPAPPAHEHAMPLPTLQVPASAARTPLFSRDDSAEDYRYSLVGGSHMHSSDSGGATGGSSSKRLKTAGDSRGQQQHSRQQAACLQLVEQQLQHQRLQLLQLQMEQQQQQTHARPPPPAAAAARELQDELLDLQLQQLLQQADEEATQHQRQAAAAAARSQVGVSPAWTYAAMQQQHAMAMLPGNFVQGNAALPGLGAGSSEPAAVVGDYMLNKRMLRQEAVAAALAVGQGGAANAQYRAADSCVNMSLKLHQAVPEQLHPGLLTHLNGVLAGGGSDGGSSVECGYMRPGCVELVLQLRTCAGLDAAAAMVAATVGQLGVDDWTAALVGSGTTPLSLTVQVADELLLLVREGRVTGKGPVQQVQLAQDSSSSGSGGHNQHLLQAAPSTATGDAKGGSSCSAASSRKQQQSLIAPPPQLHALLPCCISSSDYAYAGGSCSIAVVGEGVAAPAATSDAAGSSRHSPAAPDLLVRCQGMFLPAHCKPATATQAAIAACVVQRQGSSSADVGCISVSVAGLRPYGLVQVQLMQGLVVSHAKPLLVVDDAAVAAELQGLQPAILAGGQQRAQAEQVLLDFGRLLDFKAASVRHDVAAAAAEEHTAEHGDGVAAGQHQQEEEETNDDYEDSSSEQKDAAAAAAGADAASPAPAGPPPATGSVLHESSSSTAGCEPSSSLCRSAAGMARTTTRPVAVCVGSSTNSLAYGISAASSSSALRAAADSSSLYSSSVSFSGSLHRHSNSSGLASHSSSFTDWAGTSRCKIFRAAITRGFSGRKQDGAEAAEGQLRQHAGGGERLWLEGHDQQDSLATAAGAASSSSNSRRSFGDALITRSLRAVRRSFSCLAPADGAAAAAEEERWRLEQQRRHEQLWQEVDAEQAARDRVAAAAAAGIGRGEAEALPADGDSVTSLLGAGRSTTVGLLHASATGAGAGGAAAEEEERQEVASEHPLLSLQYKGAMMGVGVSLLCFLLDRGWATAARLVLDTLLQHAAPVASFPAVAAAVAAAQGQRLGLLHRAVRSSSLSTVAEVLGWAVQHQMPLPWDATTTGALTPLHLLAINGSSSSTAGADPDMPAGNQGEQASLACAVLLAHPALCRAWFTIKDASGFTPALYASQLGGSVVNRFASSILLQEQQQQLALSAQEVAAQHWVPLGPVSAPTPAPVVRAGSLVVSQSQAAAAAELVAAAAAEAAVRRSQQRVPQQTDMPLPARTAPPVDTPAAAPQRPAVSSSQVAVRPCTPARTPADVVACANNNSDPCISSCASSDACASPSSCDASCSSGAGGFSAEARQGSSARLDSTPGVSAAADACCEGCGRPAAVTAAWL